MEDLMGKAAIYGGMVLALVAALKGLVAWLTGWRTLIPTAALSAAFAWYIASTSDPAMPMSIATACVLGIMIFGVAVGAWTGITKVGTGSLPTMKTNTPNGNP